MAGILLICAIVAFFCSFRHSIRVLSVRLFAIMLIGALTLFSDNVWTYFASIFIIGTAVTETEFLQNLAAIIWGSKPYFDYKLASAGEISPPIKKGTQPRHPMEYKILNTLWTKQVNKFPDLSTLFTFLIFPNSPEYLKFRELGGKLIGEGLIGETPEGYYHLTREGFEFCKRHYEEFPSDQWWPEETIKAEQLKKVLAEK